MNISLLKSAFDTKYISEYLDEYVDLDMEDANKEIEFNHLQYSYSIDNENLDEWDFVKRHFE